VVESSRLWQSEILEVRWLASLHGRKSPSLLYFQISTRDTMLISFQNYGYYYKQQTEWLIKKTTYSYYLLIQRSCFKFRELFYLLFL
jgi:hypothetical protein